MIGTCELCGVTDHHLVEGICPTCQRKTVTVNARREQRPASFRAGPASEVIARALRFGGGPVRADNAPRGAGQ